MTKQLQSGQALDIRPEARAFSVWLDGACVADSLEALRVALTPVQD